MGSFSLQYACLLLLVVTGRTLAVQSNPTPLTVRRGDGEESTLHLKGNAFSNWLEDAQGYPVVEVDGAYHYLAADPDEHGEAVPSHLQLGERRVGQDDGLLLRAGGARAAGGRKAAAKRAAERASRGLRPPAAAAAPQGHAELGGSGGGGGGGNLRARAASGDGRPPGRVEPHPPLPEGGPTGGGGRGGVMARPASSDDNDGEDGKRGGERRKLAATGSRKNLVVPIRFSDHTSRTLPSRQDIEDLWNKEGGHSSHASTTGMSIRDFYLEQSYDQLDITSTVVDWVTVSNTEAYYAAGVSGGSSELMEMLREALTLADASVDFGDFDEDGDGYIDMISFVHSGYGAEYVSTDAYGTKYSDRIWSHKWAIFDTDAYTWDPYTSDEGVIVYEYHIETILKGTSGSTISTIAVGCHETAHFLGLPDLYDTDGSSRGIDVWGIMANSWGWDSTGRYPPSFSAWSKYQLGWVTPTEVAVGGEQTLSLSPVQSSGQVYLIRESPFTASEYLLIEYRDDVGLDAAQPAGGVLVWHIDQAKCDSGKDNDNEGYYGQSGWPGNEKHFCVALLQADGDFELEKDSSADMYDLFYDGSSETTVYDSTTSHPSTLTYSKGRAGFSIENIGTSDGGTTFQFTVVESATINPASVTTEEPTVNLYTCADSCGSKAPGGCWCDSLCSGYGDCCDDACVECGQDCPDGWTEPPVFTEAPTPAPPTEAPVETDPPEVTDAPTVSPGTLAPTEPPVADDSCEDRCGGKAPSGCWCDDDCHTYGDCCADICGLCGYSCKTEPPTTVAATPVPTPAASPATTAAPTEHVIPDDSCEGRCGKKAPAKCYCDSACVSYGDCCDDVCGFCGYDCPATEAPEEEEGTTAATATTDLDPDDSCTGTCGKKAAGGCWCDSLCANYGDCCADSCAVCGWGCEDATEDNGGLAPDEYTRVESDEASAAAAGPSFRRRRPGGGAWGLARQRGPGAPLLLGAALAAALAAGALALGGC